MHPQTGRNGAVRCVTESRPRPACSRAGRREARSGCSRRAGSASAFRASPSPAAASTRWATAATANTSIALDEATGKQIWATRIGGVHSDPDGFSGPRGTPTVDGSAPLRHRHRWCADVPRVGDRQGALAETSRTRPRRPHDEPVALGRIAARRRRPRGRHAGRAEGRHRGDGKDDGQGDLARADPAHSDRKAPTAPAIRRS